MEVVAHHPRVELDAGGGEAFKVAEVALGGGPDGVEVAKEGDPAMAVRGQVPDGPLRAAAVVDRHGVGVAGGDEPVDDDHRAAKPLLAEQAAVVVGDGDGDEPVRAPGPQ